MKNYIDKIKVFKNFNYCTEPGTVPTGNAICVSTGNAICVSTGNAICVSMLR